MKDFPDPSWKHLAKLSNADVYEIRDDVIVIVPNRDAVDDESSARESLAFQRAHWSSRGKPGAVIVSMEPMREQTAAARGVYANEAASARTTCFALVGESFYAQAISAVFTGLAKPAIPTNVFRTIDEADTWIREINGSDGGSPGA